MSYLGLEEDVRLGDLWDQIRLQIFGPNSIGDRCAERGGPNPRGEVHAPVLSFQEERQSRTSWLASGAVGRRQPQRCCSPFGTLSNPPLRWPWQVKKWL